MKKIRKKSKDLLTQHLLELQAQEREQAKALWRTAQGLEDRLRWKLGYWALSKISTRAGRFLLVRLFPNKSNDFFDYLLRLLRR